LLTIYLAGKYTGQTLAETQANIDAAKHVMIQLLQYPYELNIICPHMLYAHLDGVLPYDAFLIRCFSLIDKADVVFLLPNWQDSRGACAEQVYALAHGTPAIEWDNNDAVASAIVGHNPVYDEIGEYAKRLTIDVLREGEAKYPNTSLDSIINKPDHLQHLAAHLNGVCLGDTSERHVEHLACRGVMECMRRVS
jgi:hypothetical protein